MTVRTRLIEPIDAGCVLYLPLWEGGGTFVEDVSPFKNHGTIVNPDWVTNGVIGNALNFGSGKRLDLGAGKFDSLTDCTISLWVYQTQNRNWEEYFSHYTDGNHRFVFECDENGYVSFGGAYDVGQYFGINYLSTILNAWKHLAVTFTSGAYKIYENGSLKNQNATTYTFSSFGTSTYNGFACQGGSGYLDGMLDELRIFSRILTPTEVYMEFYRGARKNY